MVNEFRMVIKKINIFEIMAKFLNFVNVIKSNVTNVILRLVYYIRSAIEIFEIT